MNRDRIIELKKEQIENASKIVSIWKSQVNFKNLGL